MAGIELDLVQRQAATGSADQLDQLVVVAGNRRPPHDLTALERDEDTIEPLASIFSTSGLDPQRVELTEPVDVGHHRLEATLTLVSTAATTPDPTAPR